MNACALYSGPPRPRFGWEGEPQPCGKPAAVLLRTSCIHEHVSERAVCADHEAPWRVNAAAGVQDYCTRCRDGVRPHECVLALEWAPLEAAA